jgi:hypothetical protein
MLQALANGSGAATMHSRSHRRLARFGDWIKASPDTREAIQKQAGDIRRIIGNQAAADGLVVFRTPEGGSFAKHTGLRRHMRGHSEIEGQDVDLPFVVQPATKDGVRIEELLRRFDGYAKASYPNTPRRITASSVELQFVASKIYYDLVPMLTTGQSDYQRLLKKDGSTRLTSVSKHTEFVRRRTQESDELAGRVKFNECVRLLKWWRFIRINQSGSIDEVRTTLIELLCASAYDRLGIDTTYTGTLLKWFGWLATLAARRTSVSFSDFPSIEPLNPAGPGTALWEVIDPVNLNNNVVHSTWGNIELGEFASWFADARDAMGRLVSHEAAGNDGTVDDILVELFGNPVLTHGELT